MYISYVKARPKYYQSEGYIVLFPGYKKKYFTSKHYTLDEKLDLANKYLNYLKGLDKKSAVHRLDGGGPERNKSVS